MEYKKFLLFAIALILISAFPVHAEETNYSDISEYESLTIGLNIAGEVSFDKFSKLTATLFLFPYDEGQTIQSMDSTTDSNALIKQNTDRISYEWESIEKAKFSLSSVIITKVNKLTSEKVPFPPKITEYFEYTTPSENINSDNLEIKKKANEIVAGEKDSLKAIASIAEFVNSHLEYDEAYASSVKNASWVYKNKKGVCDEYTNLVIAMVRAIGIPARYVSGVAYSNVKKDFGNHAWAEVYLPGQGWIPIDATYGQYGWIDATHVVLAKTKDTITSITYSFSSNANINAKPLSINASVIQKGGRLQPETTMSMSLLKNNVKARSYVPLEVEIKNSRDYYVPLTLYLTKSPGVYGENTYETILGPEETKKAFFVIDTKDNSEEGYAYEAAVEIKTQYGDLQETALFFSKDYDEQMDLNEALAIVDTLKEDDKEEVYDISLECGTEKKEFYSDEEIKAECVVKNNGNVLLENLKLCLGEVCSEFNLGIGEEKKEEFEIGNNEKNNIVKLSNDKISKSEYIGITILERPNPEITEFKPLSIGYDEEGVLLTITSKSLCKNAVIRANNLKIETESINLKREFSLPFKGKNILSEKVDVKLECYDFRGIKYGAEKTFNVEVTSVPGYAKVFQFFIKIFHPITGYFSKSQ